MSEQLDRLNKAFDEYAEEYRRGPTDVARVSRDAIAVVLVYELRAELDHVLALWRESTGETRRALDSHDNVRLRAAWWSTGPDVSRASWRGFDLCAYAHGSKWRADVCRNGELLKSDLDGLINETAARIWCEQYVRNHASRIEAVEAAKARAAKVG